MSQYPGTRVPGPGAWCTTHTIYGFYWMKHRIPPSVRTTFFVVRLTTDLPTGYCPRPRELENGHGSAQARGTRVP
eukprot:3550227-Rhodomonas_salina.2